ncbi:uncharacterized protein [Nicotiana tomentosiformis]|uniref:uncharacterized protein n=1 Tax=Nicotiana tomentosiformis TaxID=4098 RepID=UPI00388C851A
MAPLRSTSSGQLEDSTGSRVNRFPQLDPLVFMGTNLEEDPQGFIDKMYKTLGVMCATEIEEVELSSYSLKEVAYSWFQLWEESHREGSSPARWGEFADAFIDHFLPTETKAAHAVEFENLRQAALNSDMNYGKMVALAQATENRKLRNRMEREGSNKARFTGNFDSSSGGGRCGLRVHIQRDCHSSRQGTGRGMAQLANSAATTCAASLPARGSPTPAGRGESRGGALRLGESGRFYAMRGHQNLEASPDVVTGILTVQSHDVYGLIYPGSTLSYVTPYVAMEFGIEPE